MIVARFFQNGRKLFGHPRLGDDDGPETEFLLLMITETRFLVHVLSTTNEYTPEEIAG